MSSEPKVLSTKRKQGFFSEIKNNGALFVMLLPGVILLFINNYLPMFGVVIAFKKYRLFDNFFESLIKSEFAGIDNFKFFFQSPYAFNVTRNTILYNFVFIALDLIVPVALAIALNEMRTKKLAKGYQSLMFLPYFLSWIVVSYLAFSFFSMDKGLVNTQLLSRLGVEPVNWYAESAAWPFILTFFHMWKYTGYNVVVYIASLAGIDTEYYEAASLDGASKWQQIKYITLPMLQSIMVIMTLLAVGRIFNADFGLFYNVTRNSGQIAYVTEVIDTYVYKSLRNSNNIGMTAAAGLYQAVIGCITVFAANLVVRKIDDEKALF